VVLFISVANTGLISAIAKKSEGVSLKTKELADVDFERVEKDCKQHKRNGLLCGRQLEEESDGRVIMTHYT
jgi:hypothetical protein